MSSIADLSAFGELPVAQFEPLTGWSFTYNINPALCNTEVANGGAVAHDGNMGKVSSGTDAAGSAKIETIRSSRYIPGIGGRCIFTAVFSEPKANCKMIIGPMNSTDGWGIGYNGLQFGVVRKSLGVESWFYNANSIGGIERTIRSKVNPQKGNVFQIRYQWLGFGVQRVYIENNVGELGLELDLFYAGKYEETSVDNANLPISMCVVNDGNTEDCWIKSPSAILGLEGDAYNDALSANQGVDKVAAAGVGTNLPVFAIRMGTTYLSKANRIFAQALKVSLSGESNKPILFRAFVGGTVTGGSWSYVNEQIGPMEVNKTLTGYTPGELVGSWGIGKSDSRVVDIEQDFFRIYAGSTIVITITTTGSTDYTFSALWKQFL